MSSQTKATLGEKLDFVFGICFGAVITVAHAALRYPFLSASESQPTLMHEIRRSIVRWGLDRFNVAQLQWMLPSSSKVYKSWIATRAQAQGAPAEAFTELVGDEGTKLHWIGQKDAKKVLLHYHGGGFVLPLLTGHLNLVNHFRREIKRRSGVEVKLAFLEYTLMPLANYPTQFRQAVIILKHIIASGVSPADIFISGDSAGALLALQILSHILHPHPAVPLIPIPAVPFAGILIMSPWVIFESSAPSFRHSEKDTLSWKPLLTWGRMYRRGNTLAHDTGEPGGYWSEPLKAPPEWWRDVSEVTRNVMITYGGFEVFRDDNAAIAKKLKESVGSEVDVTSVEDPQGLHNNPTMEANMEDFSSELTKIISGWVHDRVLS